MKNDFVGILWDLDGTLVDTKALHFASWHEALTTIGIDLDHATFEQCFGRNNSYSLPRYLGYTPSKEQFDQISGLKEEIFLQGAKKGARLFPGVRQWLDFFQERHFSQAIASSAPMCNIDTLIDACDISAYFSAIIPGADLPSKPAPDVFLKAAHALGIAAENCIVIEDAPAGLQAGRSAGMKTIGVANSHPIDSLVADLVVPGFMADPEMAISSLGLNWAGSL